MRHVATSWRVIEGTLREHAPAAYRALRPPATDRQVGRLRELIGADLPGSFVSSLRVHDGCRTGGPGFANLRALLPVARIAAEYRTRRELQRDFEGGAEGAGDGLTRTRKLRNDAYWRAGWVPVLKSPLSDLVVLDLDPGPAGKRGQLFFWYNNRLTAMRVLADSFGAWLDALAERLARGRFRVDRWGGIEVDEWRRTIRCR